MLDEDPNNIFRGKILIVAPHMDDEALACGGLIVRLAQKERIHIVYATDGMKSPAPVMSHRDSISADLGKVRIGESVAAMGSLGVQEQNLYFLGLPEARLKNHIAALKRLLIETIENLQPDFILFPFRYDRHPDHLAVNQVIMECKKQERFHAQLVEYFVYHRWRLLPKRDIRAYIKPECLVKIGITEVSKQKRMALDCFKSQTTIFYPWQTRPILTPLLLDDECNQPEYFLFQNPSLPGSAVFTRAVLWIRLAHRLEPFLQKWKYVSGVILKRAFRNDAHNA